MTSYTDYPHLTSKSCIVLWTSLCSGQCECCKYVYTSIELSTVMGLTSTYLGTRSYART